MFKRASKNCILMIEEHIHNNVKYRPFKSDLDLKQIKQLFSEQFSEPYQVWTYRFFAEQYPALTFFAEDAQGQIIGCCMGMLQAERLPVRQGYIGMICVSNEHKRLGIGQHLAELAFEEFNKENCDLISLETEDDNFRAIYFYERLGFIKQKHHHRYYLNAKGAYLMVKWLKENPNIELSYD